MHALNSSFHAADALLMHMCKFQLGRNFAVDVNGLDMNTSITLVL